MEHLLGHLDPAQSGVADLVDVDDLAGDRLVLRRHERDVRGAGVDPLAERVEQLAAAGDLVEEGEDGAAVRGREGGRLLAHEPPPPPGAAPATAGSGLPTSAPPSVPCMIA